MSDKSQEGTRVTKKCPMCLDGTLVPATRDHELRSVAGMTFLAELPVETCDRCHEFFTAGDDLEHFEIAVAFELVQLGVCTGEAFRFMRKALGYDVATLTDLLGHSTMMPIVSWEMERQTPNRHAFLIVGLMAQERLGQSTSIVRLLRGLNEPPPVTGRPIRLTLRLP